MEKIGQRLVCYSLAGTIVLAPIYHVADREGELSAVPIAAPHEYHFEFSASAQPYFGTTVLNVGSGSYSRVG